jgi:hypothetical protein
MRPRLPPTSIVTTRPRNPPLFSPIGVDATIATTTSRRTTIGGNFNAISIDPGVTSGIVFARKRNGNLQLQVTQQKLSPLKFFNYVEPKIPRNSIIICEDFEFRPNSPPGLIMTSSHMIGIVMMLAEMRKCKLYMQKAAYAKSGFYADDNALKKAGVYIPAFPHGMDAMRHFMQWFTYGSGYQYNDSPKMKVLKLQKNGG